MTEPRRWLQFQYDDGTVQDFELGRATVVKGQDQKFLFHLDRQKDGRCLMLCAEEVWPEGKRIDHIKMIRNDDV